MSRQLEVSIGPSCISSGYCRNHAPGVFVRKPPKRTVVAQNPNPDSAELQLAMESCPVEAISAKDAGTGETVFP